MNKPAINVTPLIDVLLVLLIIFMVVSPLKPSNFETRIPGEPDDNPAVITNPDTLIVIVNEDDSLALNNDIAYSGFENLAKLSGDLKTIFSKRQLSFETNKAAQLSSDKYSQMVFVKAPKSMSYGKIVKVIDAVKLGGAEPISLQIDDLPG